MPNVTETAIDTDYTSDPVETLDRKPSVAPQEMGPIYLIYQSLMACFRALVNKCLAFLHTLYTHLAYYARFSTAPRIEAQCGTVQSYLIKDLCEINRLR